MANPIRTYQLDRRDHHVRVRQGAMVLRADTSTQTASVDYFRHGRFYRAVAQAVILAGQGHTAHCLVEHLIDSTRLDAWLRFKLVPVVTANVTLRRAAPIVDLGLGYNNYWWGSTYWATLWSRIG